MDVAYVKAKASAPAEIHRIDGFISFIGIGLD